MCVCVCVCVCVCARARACVRAYVRVPHPHSSPRSSTLTYILIVGTGTASTTDHASLIADLHQRMVALQRSEHTATHRAEHYRNSHQKMVLIHRKLVQKQDQLSTQWLHTREEQRARVREYHASVTEMQLGERYSQECGSVRVSE